MIRELTKFKENYRTNNQSDCGKYEVTQGLPH